MFLKAALTTTIECLGNNSFRAGRTVHYLERKTLAFWFKQKVSESLTKPCLYGFYFNELCRSRISCQEALGMFL